MSTITVLKFDATLEAKRAAIDWASIYPKYLGEPTFHREPNDKLQFLLRTIVLKAGPNGASAASHKFVAFLFRGSGLQP